MMTKRQEVWPVEIYKDETEAKALAAMEDSVERTDQAFDLLIIRTARALFDADEAYGCGFYNDPTWLEAYNCLQRLVGWTRSDA